MHWHNSIRTRSRVWIALLAVVVTATGLLVKRSLASDHQDTADVELNPSMDMTDVYAFPGSSSDRIALVLNSWALLTPAEAAPGVTSFDDNLLYQFKVDNTGDANEDLVIQVTFSGSGANQTVEVRGPIPDRKPLTGPLSQLPDTATAGSFRAPGAAVDILGGTGGHPFNVLSIVIELPKSQLRGTASDKIGVWGTISR